MKKMRSQKGRVHEGGRDERRKEAAEATSERAPKKKASQKGERKKNGLCFTSMSFPLDSIRESDDCL